MIRKSLVVWLILIAAEILHGIARGIFLVPHVGQFRSNQIGVFTGSLIILAVALVFVRWIGATRSSQLLGIGVLWLVLTLAFEFLFGHFVAGASWERLASDYNVPEGGLASVRHGHPALVAVDCWEGAGSGLTGRSAHDSAHNQQNNLPNPAILPLCIWRETGTLGLFAGRAAGKEIKLADSTRKTSTLWL